MASAHSAWMPPDPVNSAAVPVAALAPSFGTIVSVSITWLTGLQLKLMHETEAIGINYDYGIASNLVFKTSTEHKIDAIGCYLG